MPTYRSTAVVLKRTDFKEYDRILTVFTEKLGKMEVLARGVKKIQSKLAGHLEPFSIIDLSVVGGKFRDRVAGSQVLQNLAGLKGSSEGIFLANYINEVVDLITRPHQADQNTFSLIVNAYQELDRVFQKDKIINLDSKFLIVLSTLLHLLALQGFQPVFKSCFYCKQAIRQGKNFFSFLHLSAVCLSCEKKETELLNVSFNVLKILNYLLQQKPKEIKINNLTISDYKELQYVVNKMLETVSERKINSSTVIKYLIVQ